jgi:hypothetical protein
VTPNSIDLQLIRAAITSPISPPRHTFLASSCPQFSATRATIKIKLPRRPAVYSDDAPILLKKKRRASITSEGSGVASTADSNEPALTEQGNELNVTKVMGSVSEVQTVQVEKGHSRLVRS